MYVDYCGWSKERGPFREKIFVDENKVDHTIYFSNGSIARQVGGFLNFKSDWNNDGDVCEKFGAWFELANAEGTFSGGNFFTPEELVRFALDARDPAAAKNNPYVTKVTGIELPGRQVPLLEDTLRQTEARAFHREVERNKKMKALGIRPSNEPWAR